MNELLSRVQAAVGTAYRIDRQIGAGGMAIVFEAEDVRHARRVAIKVLRPELANAIGTERFLREIQIAAQVSHPHILPLYDSGAAGDLLWYTMPLVDGESLRDRITRDHQLPISDAVDIARQVAGALAHAHARGIVHRDVKPENILLHGGDAVVADFGIARALAAAAGTTLTESGITLGTAAYMSPEQATAEPVDGRSDIYSLGSVLYEMLTGHPPFLGASAQEVLARVAIDPVPPVTTARPTVSSALAAALTRALAKVPADRFATAIEFAAALDASPNAEATSRSGAATPLVRRPFARRAARWSAAAVVLVAVVLTALRAAARSRTGAAAPKSVAVLYFDSQSPDSADAYLADGLTEEIIQRLGELARFEVKSRYAVRRFRNGVAPDPATLGRTLGVGMLVNGSLRRSQHRLRVEVDLMNTATGARVWGRTYDRGDVDLLSLETEVAQAIATAVAGQLDPQEQTRLGVQPTASAPAYDHFLRGNYFVAQRTPAALASAITEYETAVRLDSTFTRPLARMAFSYAILLSFEWRHPRMSWDSLLVRGTLIANDALARDSTSSDSWVAHGMLEWFHYPSEWSSALAAHDRAVALDPANTEALNMRGVTLEMIGRDSLAADSFRRALALDPLRPISLLRLGEVMYFGGHRAAGERLVDSVLTIAPAFVLAYLDRAQMRLARRDATGAVVDIESAIRLAHQTGPASDPLPFGLLAEAVAQLGDTARAQTLLAALRTSLGVAERLRANSAESLALAMLAVGDRDGALGVLERSAPRGHMLWWNLRWPDFDMLRGDPRFQHVMAGAAFPATR